MNVINNGITRDITIHQLSDDSSRLAELLWKASARPPTGDVLAYRQGVANRRSASCSGTGRR